MKIRITESGWETYTGAFCGVMFTDAVSDRDVSPREAAQISNIVKAETLDGVNPSDSQKVLERQTMMMDASMPVPDIDTINKPAAKQFTRAELEAIADKSGMGGLRMLVTEHGLHIKAISINKMISEMLRQYGAPGEAPAEEKAKPLPEGLIIAQTTPASEAK